MDLVRLEKQIDAVWASLVRAIIDGDDARAQQLGREARELWSQYPPEEKARIKARLEAENVKRNLSTLT